MYCNGVEADQEGGFHTASVEQDAAHHALDSIDLVLGDWGGFIWGERVMGIFTKFFRAMTYGECCGRGGVSCLYF